MNFFRKHWYDLGAILALPCLVYVVTQYEELSHYQFIMWLNLISLLLHQSEEYRLVGTFPGMVNKVLFGSEQPDRYPLNTHTALLVNIGTGWLAYGLALIFADKAVWLGIATMLISVGNFIAHTLLFNIKGKTYFNAGMATAVLFFLPLSIYFFRYLLLNPDTWSAIDWWIGVPLGIALNYLGIIKMIDWFKDEHTSYIFESRQVP